MQYKSTEKYIRVSPRKIRLVAEEIKKISPKSALDYLQMTAKSSAKPLYKAIFSAVNNAKNKNADVDNLRFSNIEVNMGPVMKRWRAVSRGRAHGYKKRMSHISVVLEENDKAVLNKKSLKVSGGTK